MKKFLFHRTAFSLFVCALPVILLGWSCNYYRPLQASAGSDARKAEVLDSLQQKVFIVHSGKTVYWIDSPRVDANQQVLKGYTRQLLAEHTNYINDKKGKYNYVPQRPFVLQELHLYTNPDSNFSYGMPALISFKDISKMEVLERDDARSKKNTTILLVGIGVYVAAMVALAFSLPAVY